jgi:hypothetical protein
MITLRAAAVAALLLSGAAMQPAHATPVADLTGPGAARTEFDFGDQVFPDRPGRLDRVDANAAQAAAERYFDFDALITLGALALAGGAMAGFAAVAARRGREDTVANEPAWRESVFRAVQADLAAFTETYRRAA